MTYLTPPLPLTHRLIRHLLTLANSSRGEDIVYIIFFFSYLRLTLISYKRNLIDQCTNNVINTVNINIAEKNEGFLFLWSLESGFVVTAS